VPSNDQLNDAYDSAISMVNSYVGYNTAIIPIPLPASSQIGYLPISLSLLNSAGQPQYLTQNQVAQYGVQQITDVRRCEWYDSSGNFIQQVYPFDIAQTDRNLVILDNNTPGTPTWFYVDQYNLNLTPAPGAAGTLQVTVGKGSLSFSTDSGYIEQLPADYHHVIRAIANKLVTMKAPGNVEWNTLFQMLGPETQTGLESIAEWFATVNRAAQPQVGLVDMRRDWGTYRRRRR
jgi:hypothetical protein